MRLIGSFSYILTLPELPQTCPRELSRAPPKPPISSGPPFGTLFGGLLEVTSGSVAKWAPQFQDQFWSTFWLQSWVKSGSIWGPRSGRPISKLRKQAPGRGSQNRVPFETCSRAAGMRQVRYYCQKSLVRDPWAGSKKIPILTPPLEGPAERCRRCGSPEGVPFSSPIWTPKYALEGSRNGTPQRDPCFQ